MYLLKFMSILTLCLVCFVSACGSNVDKTTTGNGAPISTVSPTVSIPATVTLATHIGNPTVAPDACPIMIVTALAQIIPFPPNAIMLDQSPSFIDGVAHSFSITPVVVCVPGNSTMAIDAYYTSLMPQQGWIASSTYPYNGETQAACGDPYCWKKNDNGMILAVALEDVRIVGASVRFVIRFTSYN